MTMPHINGGDFTTVNVKKIVLDKKLLSTIDDTITAVHIHGHPFLWIVKEILKRAPNLKMLRVIPRGVWNLADSHRALLSERGVQIVTGHKFPQHVWCYERCLAKNYDAQRTYLQNLPGPQHELFDELLTYGLKPALIASRYFCLNDEPRVSLANLSSEFGYHVHPSYAHDLVHGVLHYLNPIPHPAKMVEREATQLKNAVARIRLRNQKKAEQEEVVERFTQNLGIEIEKVPKNLKPAHYAVFEQVWRAYQSGRLESVLAEKHSREFCVIKQLWGLENRVMPNRTQLGKLHGVCRERIRQIEQSAFERLGISK